MDDVTTVDCHLTEDDLGSSSLSSNRTDGVADDDGGGDAAIRNQPLDVFVMVSAGVAMCTVMTMTLIGNGLVVAAVCSYRRLRSVTNYFVVSLAVADLTVAVLVMPYSALFELEDQAVESGIGSFIAGGWRRWFGWIFCYFWISCDVTCCTSSILHLCVIAVERYLAIAEPLTHAGRVSRGRALAVIGAVWTCSLAISFIPIYAGWFAAHDDDDAAGERHLATADSDPTLAVVDSDANCALRVNRVYAVVSSATSFYLPLIVMVVVYAKIYRIARRKADEIVKLERSIGILRSSSGSRASRVANAAAAAVEGRHRQLHRALNRGSRDPKAVKTLGTLMGLFCFCWCPFFVFYLVLPFCPTCEVPRAVVSAITWLGYSNSAVNPFVYAYLNRDFRVAYGRLVACRHNGNAGRYLADGGVETSWSSATTAAAAVAAGGTNAGGRSRFAVGSPRASASTMSPAGIASCRGRRAMPNQDPVTARSSLGCWERCLVGAATSRQHSENIELQPASLW
jgi:hypothetical protein